MTHLFEQGDGQCDGTWFADLKAWVISEFEWNPDRPLAPLMDRFFRGYYGAAAPLVRKCYDEAAAFPRDEITETLGFNNKIILPKSMPYSFLDRAAEILAHSFERGMSGYVRIAEEEGGTAGTCGSAEADGIRTDHGRGGEGLPVGDFG